MRNLGILKKYVILTVSFIIIASEIKLPIFQSSIQTVKAEEAVNAEETTVVNTNTQATGINVAYHTEKEIREFIKSSGATVQDQVVYKEKPRTKSPYQPGSLTDETLQSALKMLNQVRYVAGISYDITLSEDAVAKTQAASLINYVNDKLSHYPMKPSDMEESLYQLGAIGAGSSNLAMGYRTINSSIVDGYMEDGDSSNIDRVGHRRWILNPRMSSTGFGYCFGYSALYAFDRNNYSASEYGVAWPAQTMPTDYFGIYYPWSISMGYEVNEDSVQVKLVRLSDQRTWFFSNTSTDGYFNVDNGGYGLSGCIIFRPDDIEGYADGDKFQVIITGLNNLVSYQVSFFDLVPVTSISIEKSKTKILKGEEIYLKPIINPSNATNQEVKWSSSDNTIAEVNEYGWILGKSYGTATITATSQGSGVSSTYVITVVPDQVNINNLSSNKKGQLTVTYQKDKSVSGYEIVYATNQKFKNYKRKYVRKASISKVTLTGLKAGKKYYVKIRPYVIINNKKIFGAYGYWDYTWT